MKGFPCCHRPPPSCAGSLGTNKKYKLLLRYLIVLLVRLLVVLGALEAKVIVGFCYQGASLPSSSVVLEALNSKGHLGSH